MAARTAAPNTTYILIQRCTSWTFIFIIYVLVLARVSCLMSTNTKVNVNVLRVEAKMQKLYLLLQRVSKSKNIVHPISIYTASSPSK